MITVNGNFIFSEGKVSFQFLDKTVAFSDITTLDELRSVLIGIASHSTQASLDNIWRAATREAGSSQATPQQAAANFDTVKKQFDNVIKESERSFRDYQVQTQEALKKAEKDYEAATSLG